MLDAFHRYRQALAVAGSAAVGAAALACALRSRRRDAAKDASTSGNTAAAARGGSGGDTDHCSAADCVLAGVELGGTTSVAAIAVGSPVNIVERLEVETTAPEETLRQLVAWLLDKHAECGGLAALGVASFGPVDLHGSPAYNARYGTLLRTPKRLWAGYPLLASLRASMPARLPAMIDTDVNAPAAAELARGRHGDDVSSVCYITVGTGVGVGAVVNGAPVHGAMHPEGGHLCVKRKQGDAYPGRCPYHGDCVEGMVCSAALAERAGVKQSELASLDDAHEVWDVAAYYLAQLCASISLLLSPERIVLSGGVMKRTCMFALIRRHYDAVVNGYLGDGDSAGGRGERLIAQSVHGNDAGIIGALQLAEVAYISSSSTETSSSST